MGSKLRYSVRITAGKAPQITTPSHYHLHLSSQRLLRHCSTAYPLVSLNLVSSFAKAVNAYDLVTVLVKLLGNIRSKTSIILASST